MVAAIPVLSAIVYGLVELIKSALAAFAPTLKDDQRDVLIRFLALIVGVGVALAFQVRLVSGVPGLEAVPPLADMIASGITLGIGSDILNIITGYGKAKTEQASSPPGTADKP